MVSVGRICWLALGICRTALSRTFAFHNFAMWACIGVWGHEVGSVSCAIVVAWFLALSLHFIITIGVAVARAWKMRTC